MKNKALEEQLEQFSNELNYIRVKTNNRLPAELYWIGKLESIVNGLYHLVSLHPLISPNLREQRLKNFPAIYRLLNTPQEELFTPIGCGNVLLVQCPFWRLLHPDQIAGNYCELINQEIIDLDKPMCTIDNWREKAKKELISIGFPFEGLLK